MALSFSTANSILKEDYKDLVDQLNQKFFILQMIENLPADDVVGKRAYHALHVTRSSGVGNRAEAGTLPTASNQGYTNAYVPMRFAYGRIQINGPTIKAMQTSKGAFLKAVDSEMQGITNDLKRDLNRQIWGTSDGVIATCGTTTTSTTVVLLNATATQVRQLWADGGMVIDIGTVASPTAVASARTVTGYTGTASITISGANVSTTSSTHKIFRTGNGGATDNSGTVNDGQKELTGLQTIVNSSGTLHAVDPSTYPVWAATVDGNSGTNRAPTESLINKNIHAAEVLSGDTVDLLLCNYGVHENIAADMRSMRRNIDTVALKAGYSGIRWSIAGEFDNDSPDKVLKLERDTPNNKLFGLSSKGLVSYSMSDGFEWMDMDGAVLSRVSNTDAYEATLFRYLDIACKRRSSHFRIDDLSEAS